VLLSLADLRKEKTLKKERAFPCTSFRKKKLLNFKRESTRSLMPVSRRHVAPGQLEFTASSVVRHKCPYFPPPP